MRSQHSFILLLLCVWRVIFLWLLSSYFLFLVFRHLILMCLGVLFFLFILLGICWASWIFWFMFFWFFNSFEADLFHYFFQPFSWPIPLFSPYEIPVIHILDLLVVSHRSLRFCLFFQIFWFFLHIGYFLLTCLKVHWTLSFLMSNLLLSPFTEFF